MVIIIQESTGMTELKFIYKCLCSAVSTEWQNFQMSTKWYDYTHHNAVLLSKIYAYKFALNGSRQAVLISSILFTQCFSVHVLLKSLGIHGILNLSLFLQLTLFLSLHLLETLADPGRQLTTFSCVCTSHTQPVNPLVCKVFVMTYRQSWCTSRKWVKQIKWHAHHYLLVFSSLPSGVYIRSDSAIQVAEQSEGCLALFKVLLSWPGDWSLRKVVGLVRPRPLWSKGASGSKAPMTCWRAWRGQWPQNSSFGSFWLFVFTCHILLTNKNRLVKNRLVLTTSTKLIVPLL